MYLYICITAKPDSNVVIEMTVSKSRFYNVEYVFYFVYTTRERGQAMT